ncbi:MAG: O-acetyl-ADP-ribose deacetylase [Dehalococcoidales bacterium]
MEIKLEIERRIVEAFIRETRLSIIRGDITDQTTEALVNAANPGLMGGGGVDGAIHRAGGPLILEECKQIISRQGKLPTGKAVITGGGNLRAKFVIHTVGPVWHGGAHGEPEMLASAYRESLKLADENGLSSVSFPSISTGAYGYPLAEATQVAIKTVISFLKGQTTSIKEVVFVLFNSDAFLKYSSVLEQYPENIKI